MADLLEEHCIWQSSPNTQQVGSASATYTQRVQLSSTAQLDFGRRGLFFYLKFLQKKKPHSTKVLWDLSVTRTHTFEDADRDRSYTNPEAEIVANSIVADFVEIDVVRKK